MAADSGRLTQSIRPEHAALASHLGSRNEHRPQGPNISSNNLNINTVYGSVETINNNNPTTNYFVSYGEIPSGDSIQMKISAGLEARYVPQALFDVQLGTGCMEGTRVKILHDIMNWIRDPKAQKIFWLTGWAGTGKSAIAWTVCSLASRDNTIVLGGSFFCSRSASSASQRDVRCVIPTLSQLLARQSVAFSEALAKELDRDPDILHKQITVQIETLLSRPLAALMSSTEPVLFVIDALDECGGRSSNNGTLDDAETDRIVSEMLDALVSLSSAQPGLPVRFLVTSRPESHIRDTEISDIELSKVLRLNTGDNEQVTADIRLYVASKLLNHKLRGRFKDKDVETLTKLCDGLFIIATTALQYTLGAGFDRAATRFRTLLNASRDGLSTGAIGPLDGMYSLILKEAAEDDEFGADQLPEMSRLLAALLSARMVLSVTAIAELLGLPADDVRAILSRLHAVVHVPNNDDEPGLRTLHASFGDYLFNRAPDHIRISESLGHDTPARACLRVMDERLYFNISQSNSSYDPNPATKPETITLAVEYACTQWVYHLASLPDSSELESMVEKVFRQHFMFWLEVMSVLGQVQRAAAMLIFAAATVRSPELSNFFRGANFFVASSHQAIELSAPHIYLSALPLAAKDSVIYKTFAPRCTGLLSVNLFGINPHGGRLVMTLKGHEGAVNSLAYSPDGLLIASGSDDCTVRIWDTRTGDEKMSPLRSENGRVTSVAFSANGTSVVFGTETGAVCTWNLLVGHSAMQQLIGHSGKVTSVALSSDSGLIASASEDRTVRVWRAGTGQLLAVLSGHTDPNKRVAFSADGEIMMSGSYDWRTNELHNHGLGLGQYFRFSPTGQSMVSVEGRAVFLWTQRNVTEWSSFRLDGHTATAHSAIFSPNSSYIASASQDKTVRIWDAGREQAAVLPLPAVSGGPNPLGISLNGANVASFRDDLSFRVWNPLTGEKMLPPLRGSSDDVIFVTISSDGLLIASASKDLSIRLWNASTGDSVGQPLRCHLKPVAVLAFTHDARRLASGSEDRTVHIWEVTRGFRSALSPLTCDEAVSAVAFSLDDRLVAAGDLYWIRVWQIETNPPTRKQLMAHVAPVYSIAFSPDGAFIISGGRDEIGRIWDVSTGQMIHALQVAGHSQWVRAVTYSPDGQLVATGSNDKKVRLWNAQTGALIATLRGHRHPVSAVGFTPDGKSLVSGSTDGTISVWNVEAARLALADDDGDAFTELSAAALDDEWLVGPSGELLAWVPVEYHSYLQLPPCTDRMDPCRVSIVPGSDAWHHGETWTSCWRGDVSSVVPHTT